MTATEEAELALLRQRAYGLDADIAGDLAAQARLAELEHRAERERHLRLQPQESEHEAPTGGAAGGIAEGADPAGGAPGRDPASALSYPAAAPGIPAAQTGDSSAKGGRADAESPAGRWPGPRDARPAWHTAMVAAVAAVAVLVGGAAAVRTDPVPQVEASLPAPDTAGAARAFGFAADPSSRILLRISVEGSRDGWVDVPNGQTPPEFPTDQTLRWTQPVGEYYGWWLWIGRDYEDNSCMAISGSEIYAQCVSPDAHARGALFVSVPYDQMTEAERPTGITQQQSVGFWWIPGDSVLVLTGRTDGIVPR